jgi:iron complex transport system ATP-binding protein
LLSQISARICEGEIWSIIGPNGAGKSTLLQCLMRINTGWTRQALLSGESIADLGQRELARRIAYVPQPGGDQSFPYTVSEFVRMGRYAWSGPFGTAHSGDKEAIENALARAGVVEFADRTLDTLSGGERQKVFIAAALAQGSSMLLLDEPTAFLDYRHQAEVAEIIRALNAECGATIITVTHDVNTALLSGGKVLALRRGEVAWSGPTSELADEAILASIFDSPFRFLDDPETGLRLVAPQGSRGAL